MLPFEKYILYIYFFFFSHHKVSLFDEKSKLPANFVQTKYFLLESNKKKETSTGWWL